MLFFFSSRRRHTRCSRDWSSDVCSSDLPGLYRYPSVARRSGCGATVAGLCRGGAFHQNRIRGATWPRDRLSPATLALHYAAGRQEGPRARGAAVGSAGDVSLRTQRAGKRGAIMSGWPFDEPQNLAVISNRKVIFGGEWIALVSHDEDDGGRQFL